jgi:hypothetical protein
MFSGLLVIGIGPDEPAVAICDPDQYPYLHEVIVEHVAKVRFRYEDAFAFGLELIPGRTRAGLKAKLNQVRFA